MQAEGRGLEPNRMTEKAGFFRHVSFMILNVSVVVHKKYQEFNRNGNALLYCGLILKKLNNILTFFGDCSLKK
jgi:hypothetical protein